MMNICIPEIFVLIMICVTLMADVFSVKKRAVAYYCAQFTMLGAFLLVWYYQPVMTTFAFHHAFVVDKLSFVLKLFITAIAFFAFFFARRYVAERNIPQGEYYVLAMLSVLGMMVLSSGSNLLTLYLGLELMSLPIYAMVAMWRSEQRCVEAAMKYFVLGAIASGLLLFGMSFIFGATQALDLHHIALAIQHGAAQNVLLVLGLVFVLAALMFKLGAAPFHMWVPDVFEGAPTSVTLFISTVPKIAATGFLLRLLSTAMPWLYSDWHLILIVIALASLFIGNLAAIAQTRVKRMLAYSSVAHAGYLLLGIIAGTAAGYASSLFYMLTYALTSLAALGIMTMLSSKEGEFDSFASFQGLGQRNPWMAFLFMLCLFSMAGIPPLVGFMAKLGVIEALISVHLVWLAVVAILFAVMASYYYIRVVKVMYFESAEDVTPLPHTKGEVVMASVSGLLVLALGIFPGTLYLLSHFMK